MTTGSDERLARLAKLRELLAAHSCPSCDAGAWCQWRARALDAIATVEAEGRENRSVSREPIPDQRGLRPGDPGYHGHRTGPGVKKAWRPRTLRNQKRYFKNRENWARFKATAGIDGRITFRSAYERAGVHHITLSHYVNGLTDVKLSTALDLCDKLGCKIQGFARAMREAWELAERRYQAQEAINEAVQESNEKDLDSQGVDA